MPDNSSLTIKETNMDVKGSLKEQLIYSLEETVKDFNKEHKDRWKAELDLDPKSIEITVIKTVDDFTRKELLEMIKDGLLEMHKSICSLKARQIYTTRKYRGREHKGDIATRALSQGIESIHEASMAFKEITLLLWGKDASWTARYNKISNNIDNLVEDYTKIDALKRGE